MAWWETFFDADYLRLWEGAEPPDRTEREVRDLWTVLGLSDNSKVLDAPCGYGRISCGIAARGAHVVGVDQSIDLLAEAERRRGELLANRLRYYKHDLGKSLPESGFDAALNIFSSLGYGKEADDLAILSTLRAAVRPQGASSLRRIIVTISPIIAAVYRGPNGWHSARSVRNRNPNR